MGVGGVETHGIVVVIDKVCNFEAKAVKTRLCEDIGIGFEGSEEALNHSIIITSLHAREALFHAKVAQKLDKSFAGILAATVAVEQQIARISA